MKREADGDMGSPHKRSRRGDEEVRLLIPSKVSVFANDCRYVSNYLSPIWAFRYLLDLFTNEVNLDLLLNEYTV